ncbi:MAG: zinc ABC transporter substrate-binding protein [Gammaproteobacteria bacterium]|nr:zinc ABC transporter substrate-binding protein [Gammaproteobacteria bacterium]MCP5407166.1 zinc ABC transporter substrate-binding protein [Chromatiaceae bacterium]MCP5408276.1 zinc ABC transporter substrate-binding protein [Chromatiaceae bacterium]MCP5442090.1 zinc ABC transporter substrate-binding protein [Chromatiaceae bacterium]
MQLRKLSAKLRGVFACLLCWPWLSIGAPEVVVSIKPVHSLIAGVMAGVGTPELLIGNTQTPHEISLSPSAVRKLSRADRVYWIGQALETPMAKIVSATVEESKSVELLLLPGMVSLWTRESGLWDAHAHSDRHGDHGRFPHQQGDNQNNARNMDPHIWLSPVNAGRIVQFAVQDLSRVDAENADKYSRNGEALLARIQTLDLEIGKRLLAVNDLPYIVFHDAYAYFERHYGLNAVGSLSVSSERMPGMRRIQLLRDRIKQLNARCVFSEPQFEPGVVSTLLEGTQAHGGRLDPLGADLPPGPDAYFLMMRNLADALVECLG